PPGPRPFPSTTLFRSRRLEPSSVPGRHLTAALLRDLLRGADRGARDDGHSAGESLRHGQPERLVGAGLKKGVRTPVERWYGVPRSEEHTSELQSPCNL